MKLSFDLFCDFINCYSNLNSRRGLLLQLGRNTNFFFFAFLRSCLEFLTLLILVVLYNQCGKGRTWGPAIYFFMAKRKEKCNGLNKNGSYRLMYLKFAHKSLGLFKRIRRIGRCGLEE